MIYIIDISGNTLHFCNYLHDEIRKTTSLRSKLVTPDIKLKKSKSKTRSKFFKLMNILINYIFLLHIISTAKPGCYFIFNIPLIPIVECFFLYLVRRKKCISVGILHNISPSHGEIKIIRNYKYDSYYSKCDVIILHDFSQYSVICKKFMKSIIITLDLPSYTYSEEIFDEQTLKDNTLNLLVLGTIKPYKNLEIILSEFKGLSSAEKNKISLTIAGKAFYQIEDVIKGLENLNLLKFSFCNKFISDQEFFKELNRCDFLLISHSSTSGSALLAAAAGSGVPIIASDLPVFKKFVSEYKSGIIFDHTKPGDLRAVIQSILSGSTSIEMYAARALDAKNKTTSWKAYIETVLDQCSALHKERNINEHE